MHINDIVKVTMSTIYSFKYMQARIYIYNWIMECVIAFDQGYAMVYEYKHNVHLDM